MQTTSPSICVNYISPYYWPFIHCWVCQGCDLYLIEFNLIGYIVNDIKKKTHFSWVTSTKIYFPSRFLQLLQILLLSLVTLLLLIYSINVLIIREIWLCYEHILCLLLIFYTMFPKKKYSFYFHLIYSWFHQIFTTFSFCRLGAFSIIFLLWLSILYHFSWWL